MNDQSRPTPNDREAVLSTVHAMNDAFGRGDIDAVMATYEASAVVIGQPQQPISGDAALRSMFAGFVAAQSKFTLGGHEVFIADDIALHLSDWTMTGVGPDGSPVEGSGLSVAVLRRQADGSWKMIIDDPFGDRLVATP